MTLEAATFRKVIGSFATGVTVVTTSVDGFLHGVTANSLTSVSLDPLLLLVCVDRAAVAHRELGRCRGFAVNILAADQKDVSSLFARQGEPEQGRLRGDTPWKAGQTGAPLIEGAVAHLECVPHQAVEAGDHTIFLGRVVAGAVVRADAEPLLYYSGAYRFLDGRPS